MSAVVMPLRLSADWLLCSTVTGSHLDLNSNDVLEGTLPTTITQLTALVYFDVSNNFLVRRGQPVIRLGSCLPVDTRSGRLGGAVHGFRGVSAQRRGSSGKCAHVQHTVL